MKRSLPGILILCVMLMGQLWLNPSPLQQHAYQSRAPAAAPLWTTCAAAFRFVISTARNPFWGFLKRAPVPRLGRLDTDAVATATARFIEELSGGRALEDIAPESMEETLGLIEAVLQTRGFNAVDYAKLDRLRQGKIVSLLKQLDKPSRFSLEAYENIWAELFTTRLGRWDRFKTVFDDEHAKRQAVALLMQEEVARLGLVKSARKYALLENPEPIIRRFRNSVMGKGLAASIFNLPIMLGMPPLVLPRFSRVRLPAELAQDLLDQGLTEVNLARVDDFLKVHSAGQFGITLGMRERYELIRRAYVAGLGVYFLALSAWEAVVRYNEISEEEEQLNNGIAEVQELLDQAQFLEEQGYDIFDDGEDRPAPTVLSRECRDLRDCLLGTLGEAPWDTNSQGYKECREFVDPNNLCDQF